MAPKIHDIKLYLGILIIFYYQNVIEFLSMRLFVRSHIKDPLLKIYVKKYERNLCNFIKSDLYFCKI